MKVYKYTVYYHTEPLELFGDRFKRKTFSKRKEAEEFAKIMNKHNQAAFGKNHYIKAFIVKGITEVSVFKTGTAVDYVSEGANNIWTVLTR